MEIGLDLALVDRRELRGRRYRRARHIGVEERRGAAPEMHRGRDRAGDDRAAGFVDLRLHEARGGGFGRCRVGAAREGHTERQDARDLCVQHRAREPRVVDAVPQFAPRLVVRIGQGDVVAPPSELVGRGQPRRAGADDGHRCARRRALNPAQRPRGADRRLGDGALDLVHRHAAVVQAPACTRFRNDAGTATRRRRAADCDPR